MPRVSIEGNENTFEIESEKILFDALADQGLELPHGCLSGSCGACRIEVISGEENLAAPSFIEKNTIESLMSDVAYKGKKIRLACRAKVKGDLKFKPLA